MGFRRIQSFKSIGDDNQPPRVRATKTRPLAQGFLVSAGSHLSYFSVSTEHPTNSGKDRNINHNEVVPPSVN